MQRHLFCLFTHRQLVGSYRWKNLNKDPPEDEFREEGSLSPLTEITYTVIGILLALTKISQMFLLLVRYGSGQYLGADSLPLMASMIPLFQASQIYSSHDPLFLSFSAQVSP